MLIDLKKNISRGEDISQAIDYTVDLSEVELDGCKPFVTRRFRSRAASVRSLPVRS